MRRRTSLALLLAAVVTAGTAAVPRSAQADTVCPDGQSVLRRRGVRDLLAVYDLARDRLYGHVKATKNRTTFLGSCRYLRSLYPPTVRIAIICDDFSTHLTTTRDCRVGTWAAAANVEIAYTPTCSSWQNWIEAQFTALRYFALAGAGHRNHRAQASMIRRYIIWRSKNAQGKQLRHLVDRMNVA
jgi:hypothetical protein